MVRPIACKSVRHRIDGLETPSIANAAQQTVRHRIDGLENNRPFGKLSA